MAHPVVSISLRLCSRFFPTHSLTVHGCLLKLDRPGEYKASLVDARFPKRSDAKAAVCLQAMSEGIGDYIRSIASAVDNKITLTMRSFSSSLVFPALTSGLSKIDTDLRSHLEYDKERDGRHFSLLTCTCFLTVNTQHLAPPWLSHCRRCPRQSRSDGIPSQTTIAAKQTPRWLSSATPLNKASSSSFVFREEPHRMTT